MANHIAKLTIDDKQLVRSDSFAHRRERAVTDILKQNTVVVASLAGPFHIHLAIEHNKLKFDITCEQTQTHHLAQVSLLPLRRIIKDYAIVCETYFSAVNTADPQKVEAIDMGRRSLHNEGAQYLQDQLEADIDIDFETLRNFFTLICELQST